MIPKNIKTIPFQDNKGKIINLPENWTIEDLVEHGYTISMSPKEAPMEDNVYYHPIKETKQP